MPQTVIHLSQRRSLREKPSKHDSDENLLGEPDHQNRLTGGTGILFCLRSLLEEAERAELKVTAAGLRVAIDAAMKEVGVL